MFLNWTAHEKWTSRAKEKENDAWASERKGPTQLKNDICQHFYKLNFFSKHTLFTPVTRVMNIKTVIDAPRAQDPRHGQLRGGLFNKFNNEDIKDNKEIKKDNQH